MLLADDDDDETTGQISVAGFVEEQASQRLGESTGQMKAFHRNFRQTLSDTISDELDAMDEDTGRFNSA